MQTQTVIVDDVTAPVPDVATLPTVSGECSASVTAPTATDNCEGPITGTTTDPTSYTVQGTYTITWTYDDGNGNTSTQTQTVIVDDVTAPVPDVATLPTVSGECSASVTAPTATDNCEGPITGTTTDPTSYTVQGTYTITWTYDDGNGNTSTQTQTVIVDDVTAPVPDVATLPTVSGECSASVTAPTATDNCEGPITGTTTDPTSYTVQGTYTITWTYDDGNGNTSTQTQTVIVDDVTAPVPDVATLPTVSGECSASVTAPTATDNCEGPITGTTTDPTSYTVQGTYTITWTYDDGNGNTSTQTQTVIVDDVTAPVPDVNVLPTINAVCSVTLIAPKATDNCSGSIIGTTSELTFNNPGNYTVIWIYDDGNGNTSSQTQLVNVIGLIVDANASSAPVQLGSNIILKASVSPATAGVTVEFFVNDISVGTALTTSPSGEAQLNIGTRPLGVYKVEAKALPNCGMSAAAYVPVFDPNGNFVTGGGWINSPAGALVADPTVIGKANFGFVSKYKKGSSQVDGNTEFQFQAGSINFKSTMHESGSLVISGGKATYRGTGTINGQTGYKFVVVAFDGNWNNGSSPDRFRIKISTTTGGTVLYDNGLGTDENGNDATILGNNGVGGGSIVIHEAKAPSKKSAEMITQATTAESLDIKVANNPAQGATGFRLQVLSDDGQSPIQLRMLDMRGTAVEVQSNLQSGATVEVGRNYTPGMYLVEAVQGKSRKIVKLLKQ
jgi:hypothetical protein